MQRRGCRRGTAQRARLALSLAPRSSTCGLLPLPLCPLPLVPPALLAPPSNPHHNGGVLRCSCRGKPTVQLYALSAPCGAARVRFGLPVGLCPWRRPVTSAEGRKRPLKHTAAGGLCWWAPEGVRDHLECVDMCTSGSPLICAASTCEDAPWPTTLTYQPADRSTPPTHSLQGPHTCTACCSCPPSSDDEASRWALSGPSSPRDRSSPADERLLDLRLLFGARWQTPVSLAAAGALGRCRGSLQVLTGDANGLPSLAAATAAAAATATARCHRRRRATHASVPLSRQDGAPPVRHLDFRRHRVHGPPHRPAPGHRGWLYGVGDSCCCHCCPAQLLGAAVWLSGLRFCNLLCISNGAPLRSIVCLLLTPLLRSKWAIAGRDLTRLETLAASLSGGAAPGIVVADVAAPDTLLAMARWVQLPSFGLAAAGGVLVGCTPAVLCLRT